MHVQHSQLQQAGESAGVTASGIAPFLTVEEITARWFTETTANTGKTNRDNVRELISSGAIPARKIGRRWYVHVSTVETYETGRDDPAIMRRTSGRAT